MVKQTTEDHNDTPSKKKILIKKGDKVAVL
jgi:hypothetical protein